MADTTARKFIRTIPTPSPETMAYRAAVEKFLEKRGIEVSFEFVPWSKSRNGKAGEYKAADLSFNWAVTLKRPGRHRDIMTVDYMQGTGVQGWGMPRTVYEIEILRKACEGGGLGDICGGLKDTPKPIPPHAADILNALCLDAGALDYGDYESWAAEYGYDPDSRKGEDAYRACQKIALEIRSRLGLDDAAMVELREILRDY